MLLDDLLFLAHLAWNLDLAPGADPLEKWARVLDQHVREVEILFAAIRDVKVRHGLSPMKPWLAGIG
jgi:hypothetical protein